MLSFAGPLLYRHVVLRKPEHVMPFLERLVSLRQVLFGLWKEEREEERERREDEAHLDLLPSFSF